MGDDEHEIEHQVRVLGPRRRRPESPLRVESHHGLSQVYVLERLETGCCLLRRQQSPVSFSVNLLRERAETFSEQERKKVFVRADLNVPLDGEQNITDDTRIRAAVPTLKYLLEKGANVLLTSHLGRPKDGPEDKFRLNPVVPRLTELLGREVGKA